MIYVGLSLTLLIIVPWVQKIQGEPIKNCITALFCLQYEIQTATVQKLCAIKK